MSHITKLSTQIVFCLLCSTLCMTYFIDNVIVYQNIVYFLVAIIYIISEKNQLTPRIKKLYVGFICFAIFYIVKAVVELEVLGVKQSLYGNNSTVYYFLINGMLLPAFFVAKLKSVKKYDYTFILCECIIVFSLLVSLYNILNGNIILTQDQRIQANDRLGVIQYGHLGLTCSILGFAILQKYSHNFLIKYAALGSILLGLVSMFMAGTRGALVSGFVIVAVYLLVNVKLRFLVITLLIFISLYTLSDYILNFFDSLGATSAIRIFRFLSEGGDQSSGRTDIWIDAISDILKSPILGVSCFLNSSGEITYVHNSFIEVAYALGIFGAYFFFIINWTALKTCIHVVRRNDVDNMAFAFLFIQYFSYLLFSESIIRMPLYWFFLLMMLNINNRLSYEE